MYNTIVFSLASPQAVSGEPHQKEITMENLFRFPYRIGERPSLNIIAAACPHYHELGILLFDDRRDAQYLMDAISQEHWRNPHRAMTVVFQKWLMEGNDVSWRKLIKCLEFIGLNVLSEKLEKSLRDSGDLD